MDDTSAYTTLPASKAELLDRIRRERAALEQALAGLSQAQMTAPVENGWTIKDILAHITAWEGTLRDFHLGDMSINQAAGLDTVTYGKDDEARINEAFYQRDKDKPLPEVLGVFRQSYERLLARIEALDEARLLATYTPRGRDADAAGQLADWIAGDTYEHYREHRISIQQLAVQSVSNC
jgi:uncharacterized protein (TIGR03083 family)